MPLVTVFVEIFQNNTKKIGVVLDQFQLPIRRNFEYLEKNGIFQFFKKLGRPSSQCPRLTQEALKTWRYRLLKNLKTPFFSRYSKFFLVGDWKWSKTYPVFLTISTKTVFKGVQSLGQIGHWLAG